MKAFIDVTVGEENPVETLNVIFGDTLRLSFFIATARKLKNIPVKQHKKILFLTQIRSLYLGSEFGKGSWRDNVFIEHLWRSVKYEDIYLRA